jgi:hypothetical protein
MAGHWTKDFLDEVELFPFAAHDDQVDAASLAFNKLARKKTFWMRMHGMTFDFGTGEVIDNNGGPRAINSMEELEAWAAKCPKPEDSPHWDPLYGNTRSIRLRDL